ncbi:MAG: PIG-L family deacetylase [Promethearchaeia archaeon]
MASHNQSTHNNPVLFFVPHADDLEFGTSFACIEFLRSGYTVKEILMTNSEYGTDRTDFKGKRLRRIRMKELEDANNIYEKELKNHPKLVKMGYVDGFLPLTKSSIKRCKDLLLKEKPNIVFAPDPIFPVDFHNDHINTGRIPLLALFRIRKEYLPRNIFLYYTFSPNFLLKIQKKNLSIKIKTLGQHKSQITPLELERLSHLLKVRQRYQIFKYGSPVQKLRKIKPNTDALFQFAGDMKLRNAFSYDFFYNAANPTREFYKPTRQELGLIE